MQDVILLSRKGILVGPVDELLCGIDLPQQLLLLLSIVCFDIVRIDALKFGKGSEIG